MLIFSLNMIKTLIFDWGGVLTVGKHTASIIKILERKYNLVNIFAVFDELMIALDSDKITFEEFCKRFNDRFGTKISTKEMKSIFEEAILSNDKMISVVQNLKKNYRLILLSNNNLPTIEILRNKYRDMLSLFEKQYFSTELKLRKPSKELFLYVIKDSNLNPKECLFIDDKENNVKQAQEAGLNAILFTDVDSFKKQLKEFGIKIK